VNPWSTSKLVQNGSHCSEKVQHYMPYKNVANFSCCFCQIINFHLEWNIMNMLHDMLDFIWFWGHLSRSTL